MNKGMYRRLALNNIRKNYRFFIPRILCETGLTACFYIVLTLTLDNRLSNVKGGNYIPFFMLIGTVVIALLSLILMLYVSGFLMRQRKKEYGLYTVLGMEKRNVNRVLLLESAVSSVCAVILGLGFGVLMYKLCSLLIARLLQAEIVMGFYYIKAVTIIPAGAYFLLIDTLAYLLNARDVRRTKTSQLLTASRAGEREPKTKWVILILGIICLVSGYWMSIATEDPLSALLLFFAAVILVIIGTYCLMTAGSIFVLKALKNNKRFYYKKRNMTTVGGLLFRMKQNAVGLASIAILATGVLVMTSTTFCLYTGMEEVLRQNYPYDLTLDAQCSTEDENGSAVSIPPEVVAELIYEKAPEHGLTVEKITEIHCLDVNFGMDGSVFTMDWQNRTGFDAIADCTFITEKQYMALGGEELNLAPGESAVCAFNGKAWSDNFELGDRKFTVTKQLTFFPISKGKIVTNAYGFVLANEEELNAIYELQKAGYGTTASEMSHKVCVTFTSDSPIYERGEELYADVHDALTDTYGNGVWFFSTDAVWKGRESLYGMYGTLLFLGIILGIVCLFATVLIIYYKQISEGFEDRERFVIMQKIGMSGEEVRATIRRQILMVFFLPLITAGVHIAFACPILTRMLRILLLTSTWAFVKWILISYAAFAAVYALIYIVTARTYYKIVS